jgi:hypothetical protein
MINLESVNFMIYVLFNSQILRINVPFNKQNILILGKLIVCRHSRLLNVEY